jgi:hypothetical protein
VLNCIKFFFLIHWDGHIIFILHFLNVIYHIYWFVYDEVSLHHRNKYHLVLADNLFRCFSIKFVSIWGDIYICIYQ